MDKKSILSISLRPPFKVNIQIYEFYQNGFTRKLFAMFEVVELFCSGSLYVFNQCGRSKTKSISLKRLVVFQARRYKRNERPGNVCFPTGFKSNLKRSMGTRNVTLF